MLLLNHYIRRATFCHEPDYHKYLNLQETVGSVICNLKPELPQQLLGRTLDSRPLPDQLIC